MKNWLILVALRGNFWPFWGRKSHILDFFKVVLELFGKCLGIVFNLKRLTFCLFSAISYTLCYPYLLLSFGVPRSPNKCRQGFTRAFYSPKERFLKEPHRGVPFVRVLSFLYLIDFKILPPYDTNFSTSYSPKERFSDTRIIWSADHKYPWSAWSDGSKGSDIGFYDPKSEPDPDTEL